MNAWYALAVHTRSEQSCALELHARADACDVFVPVKRERRAWSDRVVTSEVPLFPGYVFVRTALTADVRVRLLKVRGVRDLVGRLPGDARIARAVGSAEIEALRILVDAERALDPIERLARGTHVFVAAGPLKGACGVVEQGPDGQRRLVVQIELLGRGVRTVLGADDVVEALDRRERQHEKAAGAAR
jgi:transcription termination/antitermination protein NusG